MFAISRFFMFFFLTWLAANAVDARETLKISAPPSIWVQETEDKLTGPIIEFLEEIFSGFGIEISTERLPWARAIKDMESGRLDIIPVIFQTKERERAMAFSVPYVDVPTVVFVARGKAFSFKEIGDLVGRRGLVMRSDSISPEFDSFRSKLDITEVKDYATILKMLASGRVEYAVCAKYGFLVEAKKHGYEEKIVSLEVPVASRNLHIAISQKSPFLKYLSNINNHIQAMQADGTMTKIVTRVLNRAAGM